MFTSDDTKVCIIGVGFVGFTTAMALCSKGLRVVGVDTSEKVVSKLSNNELTLSEPGISDLLRTSLIQRMFQIFHSGSEPPSLESAARACTVFVITVGTPLLNGKINLEHFRAAIHEVQKYLKDNDLVIVRSTVSLGTTRREFTKILGEQKLSKIHLSFCPERTMEGNALTEFFALPQIIGGIDIASADKSLAFFKSLGIECVVVSSLEAAELTKLVNNTYRDLMFGFSNEIAELSSFFGLSASEVIDAANHNYPRSNIAKPGPSGGPCLEKDPWILVESGSSVGLNMAISRASREVNERAVVDFLNRELSDIGPVSKVSIIGISFKSTPETIDTRGSFIYPVIDLIRDISPHCEIACYEPSGFVGFNYKDVVEFSEISSAIKDTEVVILLNKHQELFFLQNEAGHLSGKKIIIDLWGQLKMPSDDLRYRSWA